MFLADFFISTMTIIRKTTANYTPNRAGGVINCIKLHSEPFVTLEQLDAMACRRFSASKPHSSFHFAVSGGVIHQYVDVGDTAWSNGGGNDDDKCINIFVAGVKPMNDSSCPLPYADDEWKGLGELLCKLFKENTVNGSSVSSYGIELLGFPVSQAIEYAKKCKDTKAFDGCAQLRKVDGCETDAPILVSDNGCVKELLLNRPTQVCDYSVNLPLTTGIGTFKGIQVNGEWYGAPSNMSIQFPTAPELTIWLNTLGLGVISVNFVNGNPANFTVQVRTLASEKRFEVVSYVNGVVPVVDNFASSNCVSVIRLRPVTSKDLATLLGLTCPAPAPAPLAFGAIDYNCGLYAPIVDWANAEWNLTSIGGTASEVFASSALLLARVNTLLAPCVWTWNESLFVFETTGGACADFRVSVCTIPAPAPVPVGCQNQILEREVCYVDGAGACQQGYMRYVVNPCGAVPVVVSYQLTDEMNVTVAQTPTPMPQLISCNDCLCSGNC